MALHLCPFSVNSYFLKKQPTYTNMVTTERKKKNLKEEKKKGKKSKTQRTKKHTQKKKKETKANAKKKKEMTFSHKVAGGLEKRKQ